MPARAPPRGSRRGLRTRDVEDEPLAALDAERAPGRSRRPRRDVEAEARRPAAARPTVEERIGIVEAGSPVLHDELDALLDATCLDRVRGAFGRVREDVAEQHVD